ncbi:MAG TPA: carboxylesterase family protein [Herbaspirillum sp.]
MRITRILSAGIMHMAAIAVVIGLAIVPAQAKDAADLTVQTTQGPVQGFHKSGVTEFLGIPYAAPPLGTLRWQPPQPHASWTDVLQTTSFGGTCTQNQSGQFAKPSANEDCLYLNIYTPNNYAADTKLKQKPRPVMVWFYGGGLVAGESNDYDGSKLARQGNVIVVTVNFRVGTLGFFAHPAIEAEGHDVGNYGLMDLQFALKWVQMNAGLFGGDRNNVTIFGQSGGATAVMANLVSPTAAGLFQRIINESGTHIIATPMPEAEAAGKKFADKAGCTTGDVAACLRKLTPEQIIKLGPAPASYYIQDGKTITKPPYESFKDGSFNHATIMTGLVADEQSFFLPELQGGSRTPINEDDVHAFAASIGKAHTDDIMASYPASSYASPSLHEIAIAQGNKACTARNFDRIWSQYVPVHAYLFDQEDTPSYLPQASYPTRAFHTSELLYIFPLFKGGQGTAHALTKAQEKLSDEMVRYWTNFAWTGNPNGAKAGPWKPYSSAADNVMILKSPKSVMADGYGKQRYTFNRRNDCALWDKINLYTYESGGR